ncbi:hypothetical protein BABINDRAFT_180755 [Babjeviella inositovora NRRL Y-12698]|uniref:Acetyltransferase component of pyruvate dehydrogenase complex n=1 Tax=Babjeviella inositovora NRRL Y-12698 TaxID=984486 RepID=A0A1E3QMS8_9ASCO|nr:uncharacterized protein BABINDRAFT_180755 [Babjeviella inositovora NRRL Y-12698]ODQ79026.1 hypothetical protein BABINDRAFT_180755 [Babjeviella inositovora NRRL Y-12698]
MSVILAARVSRQAFRALPQVSKFSAVQFARYYAGKSFPPHTVIAMPALSPTMTQGGIAAWSKAVGDELAAGEAIAEIETDKAQMDFEFQDEGFLAKILMDAGTKDVPVGKPIAVYVEDKADVAAFADFTAEDASPAAPSAEAPKAEEAPKTEAKANTPAAAAPAATKAAPAGRIFASPYAKTLALEKGVSLKDLKGTGPNGRIVAKDVESYVPQAAASVTAASATTATAAATATYEDIPISGMRKVIASRLLQSTQQSPTYIVSSQISVSKLLKLRASLNASAEDRYRLSVNDLLVKAIAVASRRVPQVNSAWLEEAGVIRQYSNVDVSVAVATPTGLITPIVKNAHTKGLSEISAEIKDLGKRAKAGKLAPEEYQGGTITISNLGMNPAVTMFTSIINPPQSAIVAIGTVEEKAIRDDTAANGVAWDQVINITGTFDHRTIDGALGGEWMKALKKVVENPLEIML